MSWRKVFNAVPKFVKLIGSALPYLGGIAGVVGLYFSKRQWQLSEEQTKVTKVEYSI